MAGGLLAVAGLLLWRALPVEFPPYLATAALALGYGVVCRWGRWKDGGTGKS